MKGARQTVVAPHRKWQWPVDIEKYDREPSLNKFERAAIERLLWPGVAGAPWSTRMERTEGVQRLLTPLQDVLVITSASQKVKAAVLRVLFRRMYSSAVAF